MYGIILWIAIGFVTVCAMYWRAHESPIWIPLLILSLFGPILIPLFFLSGLCSINSEQERMKKDD